MTFRADLHIHSCLSPCGDLDNSPAALAHIARERGLDLIALTDHNSALNTPAFAEACSREGVAALYGLEITTREELHVLCLFADVAAALSMSGQVHEVLPAVPNDPERFGDQVYVDAQDVILGEVDTYLVSAVSWSMEETLAKCHALGGLFIPAHIDRSMHSVWSQLGFLPDGPYDAVEVTKDPCPIDTRSYPVITDSDAHYLDDVGTRSFTFEGTAPSFTDLRTALTDGAVTADTRRRRF
ncbi:MAG: PHP domain-containing protein [Spirochaetota bacterium]